MAVSEVLLRNCAWGVQCDKTWSELSPTGFENVRHCEACDSPVHFCEDDEQLVYALKRNWCVSFVARQRGAFAVDLDDIRIPLTGLMATVSYRTFTDAAKADEAFTPPPRGYASKDWSEQSPLQLLGYRVGRKGQSPAKRRRLLEAFYGIVLPTEFPKAYAKLWGIPGSKKRRDAMVRHIRWLARQAATQENADAMAPAISDLEEDAAYVEAAGWS